MHINEKKSKAEILRSQGKPYSVISRELNVAKSTLSYWLSFKYKHIFSPEKQKLHLEKARVLAHEALKKIRLEKDDILVKKISKIFTNKNIDIFTKKVALSMLYWAEGSKHKRVSGIIFANTDPMLVKAFTSLLKQSFEIDTDKIKLKLHIHNYHNEKECKKFWSDLIGIKVTQFNKTYIKPRSVSKKFRENFRGICFVIYPNSGIRKEILEIGKQFCASLPLSSFNG